LPCQTPVTIWALAFTERKRATIRQQVNSREVVFTGFMWMKNAAVSKIVSPMADIPYLQDMEYLQLPSDPNSTNLIKIEYVLLS
jgi:hypothetical protein